MPGDTIETGDVRGWLHLAAGDSADDDDLTWAVAATVAWCSRLPAATVRPWPDDVRLGAIMLAARLYRRRNTPSGVESFTDAIVYVPRRDSDVDRLLALGAFALPRVG